MGVGRSLFNKAKQLAIEYKFDNIVLIAVQEAQSFWSHLGFVKVPESELNDEMQKK